MAIKRVREVLVGKRQQVTEERQCTRKDGVIEVFDFHKIRLEPTTTTRMKRRSGRKAKMRTEESLRGSPGGDSLKESWRTSAADL